MIKYTGEFKDLVPLGFQFQKMYAGDYRCYTTYKSPFAKKHGLNTASCCLWIWQARREICIDDYHGHSDKVYQYMRGKTFPVRKIKIGKNGTMTLDEAGFILNTKTGDIQPRRFGSGGNTSESIWMDHPEKDQGMLVNEWHQTYREGVLSPKEFNLLFDTLEGHYEVTA